MDLKGAINKIFQGNCTLFTGVGFSHGATNVSGTKVPTSAGLTALLDKESGEESDNDLGFATDNYIEAKGLTPLMRLLKGQFQVRRPSKAQKTVIGERWKRIYTTNYDDSIEVASRDLKDVPVESVTLSDRPMDYFDKSNVVVHLNGCITRLNSVDALESEFRLSEASYNKDSFADNPWGEIFRTDLDDSDAVFFVGFSMNYDLDIRRIVANAAALKEKAFFIIAPDASEADKRRLSRYGTPVAIGLDAFAEMIEHERIIYTPSPIKLPRPLLCFKKIESPTKHRPALADADVLDLIIKGDAYWDRIGYSLTHPDYQYFIRRAQTDHALKIIDNGQRFVVVHSDLGNGKTLFLQGLALELAASGHTVYYYERSRATQRAEVERICADDAKAVIIVDGYRDNLPLMDDIVKFRTEQTIITSERTSINDMSIETLVQIFKNDFQHIDLNLIDSADVGAWIRLFDKYGLWGRMAADHYNKKWGTICDDFRSRVRNLIIHSIKGSSVYQRLGSEYDKIKASPLLRQAAVLVFVSTYLTLRLDPTMVSYALDNQVIGNGDFLRNPSVREFIEVGSDRICIKSSILAEIMLHHAISDNDKIDVLIATFKRFDGMRRFPAYHQAMSRIMSLTNLQRLFGGDIDEDNVKAELVRFYQEVRKCRYCENNPYYWLQYAILMLAEHDLDASRLYFDNAYSYSRRLRSFDTYQIDNHYARYLIEAVLAHGTTDKCMEIFEEAHAKLVRQSKMKDNCHYVFKVAQRYRDFHDRFFKDLSDKDKKRFLDRCRYILDMIDTYESTVPEHQRSRNARRAYDALAPLLPNP